MSSGHPDNTQAIMLAPEAAPMLEAQGVPDRARISMADTGMSGSAAKSTSWLLWEAPRRGEDGIAHAS